MYISEPLGQCPTIAWVKSPIPEPVCTGIKRLWLYLTPRSPAKSPYFCACFSTSLRVLPLFSVQNWYSARRLSAPSALGPASTSSWWSAKLKLAKRATIGTIKICFNITVLHTNMISSLFTIVHSSASGNLNGDKY